MVAERELTRLTGDCNEVVTVRELTRLTGDCNEVVTVRELTRWVTAMRWLQ